MEVFILLLIFGAVLLLAAASLWFSKDPKNSILMARVAGAKKMPPEKVKAISRQIASAVFGVALAIILFCIVKLIKGE